MIGIQKAVRNKTSGLNSCITFRSIQLNQMGGTSLSPPHEYSEEMDLFTQVNRRQSTVISGQVKHLPACDLSIQRQAREPCRGKAPGSHRPPLRLQNRPLETGPVIYEKN